MDSGNVAGLSKRRHHPLYYDPDGKLVFIAGESLYRTNPHSLRKLSPVFEDMLTVGSSGTPNQDGTADANAITFYDSEADVDALFNWLTKLGQQPPSVEEWVSVLKLATKYLIKKARVESVSHIEQSDIASSRLLQLGLAYSVPHWIRRGAISLLDTPFPHLSPSDYSNLPDPILHRIALAAWEIMKMRLALFNKPPTVHHVETCGSPDCGKLWPAFWAKASQILTLCPNNVWAPASRVLNTLERAEITGLQTECKTATLSWLQANRILHPEDRIKDKAVQDIIAFCDVKEPDFSTEPTPNSSVLGINPAPGADVEMSDADGANAPAPSQITLVGSL